MGRYRQRVMEDQTYGIMDNPSRQHLWNFHSLFCKFITFACWPVTAIKCALIFDTFAISVAQLHCSVTYNNSDAFE